MSTVTYHITNSEKKGITRAQDVSRIYVAEVMDTRCPLNNGDIKVWVLDSFTNKKDPTNWITAKSSTGIYGNTINFQTINKETNKSTEYSIQNTSFGNWFPMPYVGNYVFIFYPCVSGENTIAYWFGCPMNLSNEMLPGISYDLNKTNNFNAKCEKNYKNFKVQEASTFLPLQNGLELQGLDKDRLRGISTASPIRDNPSHCYGFLSPLGNQMVIDDGWSKGDSNINWINDPRSNDNDNSNKDDYGVYHSKKEWIASISESDKDNKLNRFHGGFRFRTRNGTQLLILDCGNIYMINKDGTAWMELSDDGYIDCYSAFGINAASDGDINLHAPNINIEATDTLTLKGNKEIILQTSGTTSINSASTNVSTKICVPKITATNGFISTLTSGTANISGTFAGTLQGTAYFATSAGTVPINQPIPNIQQEDIDTPNQPSYNEVKLQVGLGTTTSINTRVPTHEPWAGHDKNNSIPELIVKQVLSEEEKIKSENIVNSNQVK